MNQQPPVAEVLAFGAERLCRSEVEDLRKSPSDLFGRETSPTFLKHADDQTIVALASICQAIETSGRAVEDFADWAVVAAPKHLGRISSFEAIRRARTARRRGCAHHTITQCSLHAVSGMVSVALGIKGPNFGVGGGADALMQGLLDAAMVVGAANVPGVWLLATQYEEEPDFDESGEVVGDPICVGAALALAEVSADEIEVNGAGRMRLRIHLAESSRSKAAKSPASVEELIRFLQAGDKAATWRRPMNGGLEIRLQRPSRRQLPSLQKAG